MTEMKLNRRDLFTVGGACAVTAAASGPGLASMVGQDAEGFVTACASCTMECLHCHLKAFVKDGKIVRIESSNPYEGKACARGLSRIKWVYAEDRVLTPLKRVGEKGEGRFEPITWDEALDTIAAKMKDAIAKDGSKSILMTSASGNMDSISNGIMKTLGAYLSGVTFTAGSLCCSAVTAAMEPMVGMRYVDTRDTIADSKFILCWGNNPMVTMQAYWPRHLEAQRKGAKIVVIDPRKSETAARADQWIPIRPNTDAALALGMIRVFREEKLFDEAFLKAHTGAPFLVDAQGKLMREKADDANSYLVFDAKTKAVVRHDAPGVDPMLVVAGEKLPAGVRTVFTMLLDEADPWTLDKTSEETEIPKDVIAQLAREYAKSGASMIIANMGTFQRIEYGTYAAASHFAVAMLTGNIGRAGTGVCDAGGVGQMAKFGGPVPGPKTKPAAVPPIPTAKLGEAILTEKPNKINVWYSQTCAPIGQWPNTNKVVAAMKKVPFVVVAETLMTPTAKHADIVLPAATVFEYESILAGAHPLRAVVGRRRSTSGRSEARLLDHPAAREAPRLRGSVRSHARTDGPKRAEALRHQARGRPQGPGLPGRRSLDSVQGRELLHALEEGHALRRSLGEEGDEAHPHLHPLEGDAQGRPGARRQVSPSGDAPQGDPQHPHEPPEQRVVEEHVRGCAPRLDEHGGRGKARDRRRRHGRRLERPRDLQGPRARERQHHRRRDFARKRLVAR